MVDDINPNTSADVASTEGAEVAKEKKTRGPGRRKAAVEAVPLDVNDTTVKSPRGRKKRTEASEEVATKAPRVGKRSKTLTDASVSEVLSQRPTATGVAETVDEFADLLRLEEENKQLRKSLSEKLRAENADLRKRLGLD